MSHRGGFTPGGAGSAFSGLGGVVPNDGDVLVAGGGHYARLAKSSSKGMLLGTGPVSGNVDYFRPAGIVPADRGIIAESYPVEWTVGGLILSTYAAAGTLLIQAVPVSEATTVNNVEVFVTTAGATLTSGRCFAALYTSAGALLAQSVDQVTNWQSTGWQAAAITGGVSVPAGIVYAAFSWAGTTAPTLLRGNLNGVNVASINRGLNRSGTAATGVTTTAPANLSTFVPGSLGPLVYFT